MKRTAWTLLAIMALGLAACSSTTPEDELLAKLSNLDKDTIFKQAEDLFAQEEYTDARKYYQFIYDSFPNDPLGHKAALRVADTYAVKNDSVNLTEARLRYRDFVNRYPNDPDRDQALLKLGNTYFARRGKPDLDLTNANEAMASYQQLINLYPQSQYVADARDKMASIREMFAEHEWMVARYYARNKRWRGTQWRLEYLKEHYPDYPHMDQVDALLEQAKTEVARRTEIAEEMVQEMREKREKQEQDRAEKHDKD